MNKRKRVGWRKRLKSIRKIKEKRRAERSSK